MNTDYKINRVILVSRCGNDGKIKLDSAFDELIDLGTEEIVVSNAGSPSKPKTGYHWLVAKNKIKIYDKPSVFQKVQMQTGIRKPEGSGGIRESVIFDGEKPLIVLKTMYAMIDDKTGKKADINLLKLDDLAPCMYLKDEFESIRLDLKNEIIGTYKVNANDIDFVQHMNNVAYIRAFQSLFTLKEWEAMNITDLEIHYIKPALEGEVLEFRKKTENGKDYYQISSDGIIKTVIITK